MHGPIVCYLVNQVSIHSVGWTGRADIAECSMFQAYSVGLRSGDFASQSIFYIVDDCKYSLVTRALCGRELSSTNITMKSGPIALGEQYTSKIALTCRAAGDVPFIYRSDFACMLIPAHTTLSHPQVRSWLATNTLIGRSAYPDSFICEVHAKFGFVSEQYWDPVIQRPSDVSAKLET